jgi:hypothetical protein
MAPRCPPYTTRNIGAAARGEQGRMGTCDVGGVESISAGAALFVQRALSPGHALALA